MESFARAVLLFFAAALLLAYLHGGSPAVRSWLRAKFLGSPQASTLKPNGG